MVPGLLNEMLFVPALTHAAVTAETYFDVPPGTQKWGAKGGGKI